MYTCQVFNEFSMNPSYIMDFETRVEVSTFISRVSKSPYFLRVQITSLDSLIKMIEDSDFMGYEYKQIGDTLKRAQARTRKKLFEMVQIGDEVTYHNRDYNLLTGIVTEKFADSIIVGKYAFDPLCIIKTFNNNLDR